MLKKIVLKAFPPQTKRGRYVKKQAVKLHLAKSFHFDAAYQQWMDNAEAYTFIDPIKDYENSFEPVAITPLFSIVIPMYNTPSRYLDPLIDSIINQSFSSWELILADGSTDGSSTLLIKDAAAKDARIKYHKLKENQGISGNTTQGLAFAKGTFVVFMDHDDTLSPAALNEVAAYVTTRSDTEIIYTDEDKLTDDGVWRHSPHFKPDWSPHQFLNCNYTNHLSIIKRTLINQTDGLNTQYNGAQDYEFLFRIHSLPGERVVGHIPKVLYHWREAEGSTAADFSLKSYAIEAGRSSVEKYLKDRGFDATASAIADRPGFYEPIIAPSKSRSVAVIVSLGANDHLTKSVISRLRGMTKIDGFKKVTFVGIAQNESDLSYLKKDDIVVQINDLIIPTDQDWLSKLAGVMEMKEVFAVSPRVLGYDGRIRDMGLIKDSQGEYKSLFQGLQFNDDTQLGHTEWIRDVAMLTGDFYAIRKKDYDQRSREIKAPSDHYTVIWSPVTATFYGSRKDQPEFFNDNLAIHRDGRISVLWDKK